jgi:hypothetical protein
MLRQELEALNKIGLEEEPIRLETLVALISDAGFF